MELLQAANSLFRLLPNLQLTQFELSTADDLMKAIKQSHGDWVADLLALNSDWLDGASEQAHTLIHSYKSPDELQAWFSDHAPRPDGAAIYKLHLRVIPHSSRFMRAAFLSSSYSHRFAPT